MGAVAKKAPAPKQVRVWDIEEGQGWTLQPGSLLHRQVLEDQEAGHLDTYLPRELIRYGIDIVRAQQYTQSEPSTANPVVMDITWRIGMWLLLQERTKRRA